MLETAILCLALNIYHEARNQSPLGQKAVAQVTMRLAKHRPERICDAVFKPKIFSWANPLTTVSPELRRQRADGFVPTDIESWNKAKKIAKATIKGSYNHVARDATFYYNPTKASPKWANQMTIVAVIDDHIFLKR